MRGPFPGAAAVGDEAGPVAPEELVPRVEADAPDAGAGSAQKAAQPVEEGAVGALQQQEDPLFRGQMFPQGQPGGGIWDAGVHEAV